MTDHDAMRYAFFFQYLPDTGGIGFHTCSFFADQIRPAATREVRDDQPVLILEKFDLPVPDISVFTKTMQQYHRGSVTGYTVMYMRILKPDVLFLQSGYLFLTYLTDDR